MKQIIILLSLFVTPALCTAENDSKGHVAFIMLLTETSQDYTEISGDFNYYYKNLEPWLKNNNYNYSYHNKNPINIKNTTLSISKEMLKSGLGYLLIKKNSSYKEIKGVRTGVDLIIEINEYFNNGT